MVLEVGETAPDFELYDQSGILHRLADYRGKYVLLYFYPKDDTPGCTKEACSFRDDYSQYQKAGIPILGVSPDSQESHTKFSLKYDLPFTLLSDPDHSVCEAYGVWGTKKMFGNEFEGVFRTTYLIGPEGEIVETFKNVKPDGHSEEVLERIRELK
jgi:peroxiredoxin Q/BCP